MSNARRLQRRTLLAGMGAAALLPAAARAALIPPNYMDAVVAIGSSRLEYSPGKWVTEGTGFFYGRLRRNNADPAKRVYQIFLVTARHVIRAQAPGDITIRVNPSEISSPGQQISLPNSAAGNWTLNPLDAEDVAVCSVPYASLQTLGIRVAFFTDDVDAAPRARLAALGTSAGDGLFVLGFPMNLAGAERNYVVARQGTVARISETLQGGSPSFMIDSFIFPGNSGGPVVLRPELETLAGTPAHPQALLIGVVTSYIPYTDTAISAQTKEPRIVFEENSGLANVVVVDAINATIDQWDAQHPEDVARARAGN